MNSIPQNGVATGNLYSLAGAQNVAAADFNGDGKPDLLVPGISGTTSYIALLIGNNDGTFQPPVTFPCGI